MNYFAFLDFLVEEPLLLAAGSDSSAVFCRGRLAGAEGFTEFSASLSSKNCLDFLVWIWDETSVELYL